MFQKNYMLGDLHIHSRFSRACSKDLNIKNLVKWAKVKGLNLLGTGDFTHPVWIEELKKDLQDNGKGFYLDKETGFPFILTGEVSLVYTDLEKGRRIHLVLLVPNFEVAEKINSYLDTKGRRDYDGRPIFKILGSDFVRDMKKISEDIEIIPAHIWTPWFGLFGSKSGFDSLKDCFKNQVENIYAIETGISSDPEMNWRIKELENRAIVSFSDSHSFWPWRLGREATIFEKTDSYKDLINQIRENKIIGTIEADPFYGKYHWDGHRGCDFSCSPKKTKELNGICPKCNNPLTLGVEYRVEELSNQPENFKPKNAKMFFKILPLHEIISLYSGVSMNSKKVWSVYDLLIKEFKNEFNILLNIGEDKLMRVVDRKLVDLILKNRHGKIKVQPGYDGEYGRAIMRESISETKNKNPSMVRRRAVIEEQKKLF